MGGTTEIAPDPAKWRRLQCFVALMSAIALFGVVRQLFAPDCGYGYSLGHGGAMTVTEVDPGGAAERAGVRVGDRIVRDPGLITFVEPWTERELARWSLLLGEAIRSGHVVTRIRRGETETVVDIVPDGPTLAASIRQLRRSGPLMPTMFAFLAVAALLARKAPRAIRPGRYLIAYCFAAFGPCWAFNWPAPGWPPWFIFMAFVLVNVLAVVGATTLAYFAWLFPRRHPVVDVLWLRVAVVAIGTFAAVISILDNIGAVRFPLPGNKTQVMWDLVMVVGMISGLAWQYRRAEGVVARRQARFLLFGLILGVGFTIFGAVGPYLFHGTSPLLFTIFFPSPVIIPLAFAGAVLRYRLFDLDGLMPKAALYAVVLITSIAIYAAVTAGVSALFGLHSGAEAEGGRWVAIVLVLALGEPLRAVVGRAIDRLLARDRADFVSRCARLAAELAHTSLPSDIEETTKTALDAREARMIDLGATLGASAVEKDLVVRSIEKHGALRVVELASPQAVDVLLALGVDALVTIPMVDSRGTKLVLGIALPLAAHLWDHAEREALASVGRVIGAALRHDAVRHDLEGKVTRADAERREIAMELHDGTGATLTAARLYTQLARAGGGDQTARDDAFDALDRTLREGLVELRTALRSIDERDVAWLELAAEVRRHAGDVCAAAGIAFGMTTEAAGTENAPARLRLTVLRVVQEALNNTVRHAHATHVRCVLEATADGFGVLFEDDGIGLKADGNGRAGGRGLANMRRRVESMSGTIGFERPEAGGTRITARIPRAPGEALVSHEHAMANRRARAG